MRKLVLVTGGNTGIGESCAERFAIAGFDVVITYCSQKKLAEDVKIKIDSFNGNNSIFKLDLGNSKSVQLLVKNILEKYGKIDCLINNAAIYTFSDFEMKTRKDINDIVNINLSGVFELSKLVAESMQKQGYGKIVNISSDNSIDSYDPVTLEYDISKAGLNILTKNLAKQYAPIVNCNAIAPGWVDTQAHKDFPAEFLIEEGKKSLKGRISQPCDIANLAYFLCSSEAEMINGQVIKIDGGKK